MTKTATIHLANTNGPVARFGGRFLYCNGQHTDFAYTSAILDEVTCKRCQNKITKAAPSALKR